MNRLFKTLLLSSTLLIASFFIYTHTVSAQDLPPAPDPVQEIYDDASPDQITNNSKVIGDEIEKTMAHIAGNIIGAETSDGTPISSGAIPSASKLMAYLLTTPPIQTSYYIADVLQNTGLAQPAYAQGIGFSALTPILNIWKAFRNISYFVFILIFVIVGFMIMFRQQIDHGTVITVQMAIPKIILTLFLITFSYAIAGIVIDLIYLTIFVVTEVFQQFNVIADATGARDAIFGQSIVRIGFQYLIMPRGVAGESANYVGDMISGVLGSTALGWISSILAYLIIAVAILIAVFRTLFSLISAFISIVIQVVFAPFILMMNAIPGNQTFSGWLKSLIANAAVFPAVAIMLIIGAAMIGNAHNGGSGTPGIDPHSSMGYPQDGSGWVPPLVTTGANTSGGVGTVQGLVGLGIIMILPELAGIIKEMFESKDLFSDAALTNLGAGTGPITAPFKALGGFVGGYARHSALSGAYMGAADAGADASMWERTKGAIGGGMSGLNPKNIAAEAERSFRLQKAQQEYYERNYSGSSATNTSTAGGGGSSQDTDVPEAPGIPVRE